ncbi:MAG: YkgJ family cysteine cluster protein [Methylophilaceae bacterium]|nr:YkgJ family cysteine cluster protein [Methylophilaceae bacterium]
MSTTPLPLYTPAQRRALAEAKLDAFFAGMPAALRAEVMGLPERIARMNAGTQVKLKEVLRTADRIFAHAAQFAACTRGCGHCCHVHVPIADFEAHYIAHHTGRAARLIRHSIPHDRMDYSSKTPCTFLRDGECSIYPFRPLTCRMHLNFDVDAHWCLHENWNHPDAAIPRPDIGPLMQAYALLGGKSPVMADIRDFFPAAN